MNRLTATIVVTLLLLPTMCERGVAQQITGGLLGHTITTSGAPISGVVVTVCGANLQGERQTATDERGEFLFVALPVGTYQVRPG